MGIVLKNSPVVIQDSNSYLPAAAILQLPQTFERRDYSTGFVDNNNGNARVYLNGGGVDFTSDFNIGDTLFYLGIAGTATKILNGIFTVIAVDFSTETRVTISANYADLASTPSSGYINNLTARENYRLNIQVMKGHALDDIPLFENIFNYSTPPDGNLFVDLGPIMTEYMRQNLTPYVDYYFKYWETWAGLESGVPEPAPEFNATFGTSTVTTTGNNVRLQSVLPNTTGVAVGDWVYIEFNSVYPNGNYKIIQVPTAAVIDIELPYISGGVTGTISPARAVEPPKLTSDLQSAVYGTLDRFAEYGANMLKYCLTPGIDPTPFNITDFFPTGGWFPFGFPADGWPDGWRINDVEQGTVSDSLQINRAGSNTALLTITCTYVVQVENNTSGTVPITFSSPVAGAMGTYQFPADAPTIKTFSFNRSLPYDIPAFRFEVRPTDGRVDYFVMLDVKVTPTRGVMLTRFKNPVYWLGWARPANFLIDSNLFNRVGPNSLHIQFRADDINKNYLGTTIYEQLGRPFNGIVSGDKFSEVIAAQGNAKFIRVYFSENNINSPYSEPVYYKVKNPCKNPVCVYWLNTLGAFDTWLFEFKQTVINDVRIGTVIQNPISQNLYVDGPQRTRKRTDIDTTQKILLTAENLTIDQLQALREIKASELVGLWLDKAGETVAWCNVVDDYSTDYETDAGNYTFTVILELPEGADFETSKKY